MAVKKMMAFLVSDFFAQIVANLHHATVLSKLSLLPEYALYSFQVLDCHICRAVLPCLNYSITLPGLAYPRHKTGTTPR